MPHAGAVSVMRIVDFARAVVARLHRRFVHQPEVDDVDRNLGVEARAQLLPHQLLDFVVGRAGGQFERLGRFLADRVGILARHAEQIAFDEHGVTATERLRDVTDAARGQA